MKKDTKRFPVRVVVIAVILLAVAGILWPNVLFFLSPEQKAQVAQFRLNYFTVHNPLGDGVNGFDFRMLLTLVLLIGEYWVVTLVLNWLSRFKMKDNHKETVKGLLFNCARYVVAIYFLIYGLSVLGVNTGAILASLGVLGLVIGFGAQSLIEDVITGLFIIFEGQFHVGDIVSIDNFRGTVTSIGVRTTQLTDAGGNIKIVNNSDIRTMTNLSEVTSAAVVDVGISYGADLKKAEDVVNDLLSMLPEMYPDVFTSTPTYGGVQALSASSVDLRIVAKVDETQLYRAQRLLNRELKLALDAGGIEIPFTQVVVHQAND